jgi:hypothetical protein
MTRQIINIGDLPNDGTGDPLRVAYDKINQNFENLFDTTTNVTTTEIVTSDPNQIVFETPIIGFSQATFLVRTINTANSDAQFVKLNAILSMTGITFVGSNTMFSGGALNTYDMDVDIASGNIRLLVTPLIMDPLLVQVAATIIGA